MKKPLASLCWILAILLVAGFLLWRHYRKPEAGQARTGAAVGRLLADETARLVPKHARVVVISAGAEEVEMPEAEAQLSSFSRQLKERGLELAENQAIPGALSAVMVSGSALDFTTYQNLLAHEPPFDAIVSFVGAPVLTQEEMLRVSSKRPRLLVLSHLEARSDSFGDRLDIGNLLERQVVDVALVRRSPGQMLSNLPVATPQGIGPDFILLRASGEHLPSR